MRLQGDPYSLATQPPQRQAGLRRRVDTEYPLVIAPPMTTGSHAFEPVLKASPSRGGGSGKAAHYQAGTIRANVTVPLEEGREPPLYPGRVTRHDCCVCVPVLPCPDALLRPSVCNKRRLLQLTTGHGSLRYNKPGEFRLQIERTMWPRFCG